MTSRFGSLSVTTRLTGSFVVVCLLIAVLDCVGLTGLRRLQRAHTRAEHEQTWAWTAHRTKAALLAEVWAQKNYVLRAYESDLRLARERAQLADAQRAQLTELTASPSDEAALRRLDEQIGVLREAFERAAAVRQGGDIEAADAILRGKAVAAIAALDPSIRRAERAATGATRTAAEVSERTFVWTTVMAVSIAAFAVAVGIALSVSITRPVAWLRRAVHAVGAGRQIEAAPPSWFHDELTDVGAAFRELVRRASLLRDMETRSRRLEALSARVVQAQEEERGRIARELHDSLGQALTAIKFELSGAAAAAGDPGGAIGERLATARKLTTETLEEVRRLALDLRPPALDNLGLAAALREYVRQYRKRSGTRATFEAHNMEERLPHECETALYRIAQEAVTNVEKHAAATRVAVELRWEASAVVLVVRDDGRGMDLEALSGEAAAASGIGVLSMAQRAQELGGDFQIESAPGKGTAVRVRIPIGSQKPVRPT